MSAHPYLFAVWDTVILHVQFVERYISVRRFSFFSEYMLHTSTLDVAHMLQVSKPQYN